MGTKWAIKHDKFYAVLRRITDCQQCSYLLTVNSVRSYWADIASLDYEVCLYQRIVGTKLWS